MSERNKMKIVKSLRRVDWVGAGCVAGYIALLLFINQLAPPALRVF